MAGEQNLIDRCTLAEEIESLDIRVAGKSARWDDAKHSVLRIIGEQKPVDAVEVVRCRDCKHWTECESSLLGKVMCCTGQGNVKIFKHPTDFCSYGERRTTRRRHKHFPDGDANI